MIHRISRASRRNEAGFTLIELLVVIIVLGILAAVVVFAVTGVGDKGKSASVAIDERTIQTAEETYCAQNGEYGTIDQLVAANLLDGTPKYNGVVVEPTFGPCGDTSYITGAFPDPPPPIAAGTCLAGTFCPAPPALGISSSDNDRTISSSFGPAMVQLPSGRVLVKKSPTSAPITPPGPNWNQNRFQLFDPASGATGSWSPLAPESSSGATTTPDAVPNQWTKFTGGATMLLLRGPAAWCGSNCGKVLAHFRTDTTSQNSPPDPGASEPWRLYDENTSEPGTSSAGSWTPLSMAPAASGGPYRRVYYNAAVQLTRAPCGAVCGQVLIVGQGVESPHLPSGTGTPADPEIWNPATGPTGSFRKLGLSSGYQEGGGMTQDGECATGGSPTCLPFGTDRAPTLTLLNDGRVLMITGLRAQIFDPQTEKFTDVAAPPYRHSRTNDVAALLPDGKVFATSNNNEPVSAQAMIYTPGPSGGSWEVVPTCGDGATFRFCHVLTALADGRILAKRTSGNTVTSCTTACLAQPLYAQMFNPATKTWSAVTPAPVQRSANYGVLVRETQPGSCGNLCNRVLTGGSATTGDTGGRTAVYTPT